MTTRGDNIRNLTESVDSRLRQGMLPAIYFWSASSLALAQITMGSPISMVLLFWCVSVVALLFLLVREKKLSDFLVFFFGLYVGYFPLTIKTLQAQTLETNLVTPIDSAIYIALCFSVIALAGLLARNLKVRSKLSHRIERFARNPGYILPLLAIGLSIRMLFVITQAEGEGGGILNPFLYILQLGLVMALYHATRGNRTARNALWISLVMIVIVAVGANAKKEIAFISVPLIVAIVSLNIRVRVLPALAASAALAVFLLIIIPAIHIARPIVKDGSMSERIATTWSIMAQAKFSPSILTEMEAQVMGSFAYINRAYGSYVYPSTANVDRFMLVFPTDQIMRDVEKAGVISVIEAISYLESEILPSFLTQKREEALVDVIAWEFAVRGRTSVGRPVMGLPASALALGGFVGGLSLVFLTVLPFMCLSNILFGTVKNSLFAPVGVGLVAPYVEKVVTAYWYVTFRELLIIWILFTLILIIASRLRRHKVHRSQNEGGNYG